MAAMIAVFVLAVLMYFDYHVTERIASPPPYTAVSSTTVADRVTLESSIRPKPSNDYIATELAANEDYISPYMYS